MGRWVPALEAVEGVPAGDQSQAETVTLTALLPCVLCPSAALVPAVATAATSQCSGESPPSFLTAKSSWNFTASLDPDEEGMCPAWVFENCWTHGYRILNFSLGINPKSKLVYYLIPLDKKIKSDTNRRPKIYRCTEMCYQCYFITARNREWTRGVQGAEILFTFYFWWPLGSCMQEENTHHRAASSLSQALKKTS